MKGVVLAAGYGTRLGGLVAETPKPLLDLGGVTLLEAALGGLVAAGVHDVAVNLHFRPDDVRALLGDGSRLGARVTYSYEPELLGTAGALVPLRSFLAGGPFLVHYGDVLTDHDLGALVRLHARSGALVMMLVHRRPGSNSVVSLASDGRVEAFLERPTEAERAGHDSPWVNSGIWVCAPELLDLVPEPPCDLPRDVLPLALAQGAVRAQPLEGYRCAVDSPSRLDEARAAVASGRWRPRTRIDR